MKFAQLSFEEYKKFALNHPNISIYQYPEWGQLKSNTGWDYYFVNYMILTHYVIYYQH